MILTHALPTVEAAPTAPGAAETVDLSVTTVRELNQRLHETTPGTDWMIDNPAGAHNIAVGIDQDITVTVRGHVGYYFAGMHQYGTVTVAGSAGVGLAENIMSGTVHVTGDASWWWTATPVLAAAFP